MVWAGQGPGLDDHLYWCAWDFRVSLDAGLAGFKSGKSQGSPSAGAHLVGPVHVGFLKESSVAQDPGLSAHAHLTPHSFLFFAAVSASH